LLCLWLGKDSALRACLGCAIVSTTPDDPGCRINVDTDSRMAITGQIRRVFHEDPGQFDPRKYLGPGRAAMKELLVSKIKAFGSAGHAPAIVESLKK
jgi:hypothetical protein